MIGFVSAKPNDTTVRIDYWNNVYGNFLIGNNYYWNQMGLTYANNKLAYCLEPGKWITETTYDSYTDFNHKNFSEALKQKLELIAYYGYEYKGHQTMRYYLATQELIWRELGIKEMYWSTGAVHGGDRINVQSEINTIQSLISSHKNLPSFHGMTFTMRSGETQCVEDRNKVFSAFERMIPSNHATTMAGNTLCIHADKVGSSPIHFLKNPDSYAVSLLYTKNDSQTIATFGLSSKITTTVYVNVEGYRLHLNKKDADQKENIPSGDASLKGAIYEVTNNSDFLKRMETDEQGQAVMTDLPAGTFTVKEVKASPGYQLDPTAYQITVSKDTGLEVNLDVYEKVIKNKIQLIKVFGDSGSGMMQPETEVTFGIYDKNETLYQEVTTDDRGIATVELPYGSYLVKQHNTKPGYEKVEDFSIHVTDQSDRVIPYVLHDAKVKARVKIIKQDEHGNPIKQKGIQFKIRNLDTGEYVKQKVYYPEESIVEVFETNGHGEVTTIYPLEAGRYQVEEVKAPDGYLRATEPFPFEINEHSTFAETEQGDVYYLRIKNVRPKGQIHIEKYGERHQLVQNDMGQYDSLVERVLLSNVTFELVAANDIVENGTVIYKADEVVERLVTTEGVVTSREIPLGTYCVKEVETQPGYQLDENEKCVTLSYQDDHQTLIRESLTFTNEALENKITIYKTGEIMEGIKHNNVIYHDRPLAGVVFALVTEEDMMINQKMVSKNTILFTRTTDEEGKIILENLPLGTYRLVEQETPPGYQKALDRTFTISHYDQTETITIVNQKKKANLLIVKEDADTKEKIDGAHFKLVNEKEKLIVSDLQTQGGILTIQGLEYGTYYLEETKAPSGYMKEKKRYKVNINGQTEMVQVVVKNHQTILPNTSSLTKLLVWMVGGSLGIGTVCLLISFWLKRHRYE